MQANKMSKEVRYKKSKIILGEGSYKTVTRATDEEEGKEVAFNEVKIKNYEDETQTHTTFSKEISLLNSIDHPNILSILDYWFDSDNFYFITEYMAGGTIRDYIDKNGPLSIKLIRKWGRQILSGIRHLHLTDPAIIHRDIKNDNIFVNSITGDIKIGDLGLARESMHKRFTIVGTPNFMAREMFEGEGYNEKVDIYAFGMCLIEMATGKRPYEELKETTDIYKSVLQGMLPKSLKIINDPCLKSLIMSCIVPCINRFTASQCLDHHFFHPDVKCTGKCVPKEFVAVYPLLHEISNDMEFSIVSIIDNQITFQVFIYETMKFIKFGYDLEKDSLQKVCEELANEKIIQSDLVDSFSSLLKAGLEIVYGKIREGKVHDGIIEIDSAEADKIKEKDIIITNKTPNARNTEVFSSYEESYNGSPLGSATLDEMRIIEEKMKMLEAKKEFEKKKEEELTFRLKSKLQHKDAAYEPELKNVFIGDKPKILNEDVLEPQDKNTASCLETPNSLKFKNLTSKDSQDSIRENIFYHYPLALNRSDSYSSECQYSPLPNRPDRNSIDVGSTIAISKVDNQTKSHEHSEDTKANMSNESGDKNLTDVSYNNHAVNSEKLATFTPNFVSTSTRPQNLSEALDKLEAEAGLNKLKYTMDDNTTDKIATNKDRIHDDTPSSNSVLVKEAVKICDATVSSDLTTLTESLNSINTTEEEKSPVSSDVSSTTKTTETTKSPILGADQMNCPDYYLNEQYNTCKNKYESNASISLFSLDAASITGRNEDIAKSWTKSLKEEHIETVFDLKLMTHEDWENLPLTVFSSRTMQNMLYGSDGSPLKEKQLPSNPKIKDYDSRMPIKEFLTDVCEQIGRKELITTWENKLLAEDIQTVGELKILHHEDWNRLGLSVYGFRILKNFILKKGKVKIED